MRIALAAIISVIIVGVLQFLGWTARAISQTLEMLYQVSPAACWTLCMVPAMLGAGALWRVFRLMERPAMLLTLVQSASALTHHRKELRVAGLSTLMFSASAVLLAPLSALQATAPAVMLGTDLFLGISLVFSLGILALAGLRLRKVTRFVQHNPVFG